MKKAKSSNYKKVCKHKKKLAEQHSRSAREALRKLYDDDTFKRDFQVVIQRMTDMVLGKTTVDHMAIMRYFPDKSTTVSFPYMKPNSPARRNAYQELGLNIGISGYQVVSIHSWEEVDHSIIQITGCSVDARKIMAALEIMRDSKGIIQNVVSLMPISKISYDGKDFPPDLEHDSFLAGYSYGLRDNALRGLMERSEVDQKIS